MTLRRIGNIRHPFSRDPNADRFDLAQPFAHRLEVPHDEYDEEQDGEPNQFEHGELPFGHEDGDPRVPEACWGQWGKQRHRRHYNPSKQWGDRKLITITNGSTIPQGNVPLGQPVAGGGFGTNPAQTTSASPNTTTLTGQLIDLKLFIPAVCIVYLSAVDTSGTLVGATLATLFVEWTLDIGCGRAAQKKMQQQLVAPSDNSVQTAIQFQQPIQALRVSGQVFDTHTGVSAPIYTVECVATCAPFSVVLPENVMP